MYSIEKKQVLDTALEMKAAELIHLSGGNVSMRMPNGDIIITPSGLNYEKLTSDQMLVLNKEGEVIEGDLRPSVDTQALLHIYNNKPNVNAIIHTHQPYATTVSIIADELPAVTTTLCNTCKGSVSVAPFASAASLQMGIEVVEHIGDKLAIILKSHGVITVGKDLSQALYAAVYLEDTAKCYLMARSAVSNKEDLFVLSDAQVDEAIEVFNNYGQK